MAIDAASNFGYGVVLVAPSPALSGTSLTLNAGQGALLPAVPFNATVWPTATNPRAANAEIVTVTNVAGDVLTIVRAQEGTAARAIAVGDQIAATITKKFRDDVVSAIAVVSAAVASEATTRAAADDALSNSHRG